MHYRPLLLKTCLLALGLLALALSCTEDSVADPLDLQLIQTVKRRSITGDLTYYQLPQEGDLQNIPAGIGNPLTPEKVELGRLLFFETALARDAVDPRLRGTFSCATCHLPSAAFTAGNLQGIADGAAGIGQKGEGRQMVDYYREDEIDAQGARPLSMLGVAYVTNSMWAGRFGAHDNNEGTEALWGLYDPATELNHLGLDGLETQNIEGTHTHRLNADSYVLDSLGYRALFDAAFADWPTNARYGREAMSFALSAYIRTLLPNRAPWQYWLAGELDALDHQQKEGALLFFGKAGCYRCHQGPALNGNSFHALGVRDLCDIGGLRTGIDDTRNLGRADFTRRPEDMYAFKVPQLYNLRDMPFYFHGSSMRDLREVVDYFNRAEAENPRIPAEHLSPWFEPLELSRDEQEALVAFLRDGLHDPDLNRYVPTAVLSGNCLPNNDPQSRQELGCD